MNFNSYELTDFNIKEHINLREKCGLIKIMRVGDGKLILLQNADYGVIDHSKPTPASLADVDAILGFVLDIGIRREKVLTPGGSGAYIPHALIHMKSQKVVRQTDYDENLMEKIGSFIEAGYQSSMPEKQAEAVKINHLLVAYNDARLLYPNFYNESYLGLMRILDSLADGRTAIDFAVRIAELNDDFNAGIFDKVLAIPSLVNRLDIAKGVFDMCLSKERSKRNDAQIARMETFDDPKKFVFSCLYSAYQYRNKFVHIGFPFPDIVTQPIGLAEDSGMAYLHPAQAASFIKIHRPDGLEEGDTLDIHCVVNEPEEAKDFKEKYFQLIPTWHFMKSITRVSLLRKINLSS